MDRYLQAKQVMAQKGARAAGVPFLTQYQLGGVVSGLAVGYGVGSFWIGCVIILLALIGLAVFQQELVIVRIGYVMGAVIRNWLGRPLVVDFDDETDL